MAISSQPMIRIHLDSAAVGRALARLCSGLPKYLWIQGELRKRDVSTDGAFQKAFNGFYRVRRNSSWRLLYFAILEREKHCIPRFAEVLREFHAGTGRIEASFVSKLVATVDPGTAVIDSVVLANLGIRLPLGGNAVERITHIVMLHECMEAQYFAYLDTEAGHELVTRFRHAYPSAQLTEIKMLDLVLWQTRGEGERVLVGRKRSRA